MPHDPDPLLLTNLSNLAALWRTLGADEVAPGLWRSRSWPYRLWWDPRRAGPTDPVDERLRLDLLAAAEDPRTLTVWSAESPPGPRADLEATGLEVSMTQVAMDLDLTRPAHLAAPDRAPLELLPGESDPARWSAAASRAFGYPIEEAVFPAAAGARGLELFRVEEAGRTLATALALRTDLVGEPCSDGEVLGVHLVGVVPRARRRGLAARAMDALLAHGRAGGARLATLQASAMGLGLYEKLGFQVRGGVATWRARG